MGHPRYQKKLYQTPGHPWQASRIKEEAEITKKYGTVNKKEIWRMNSLLRTWRSRARIIAAMRGEKREKEEAILIAKLQKLGVLGEKASLDDVLSLEQDVIFEKRLQTVVYKMGMANTVKQARQFVVHGKVTVNGIIVNGPSYIVKAKDKISFLEGFSPAVIIKKMVEEGKKIKAEAELIKAKEEAAPGILEELPEAEVVL